MSVDRTHTGRVARKVRRVVSTLAVATAGLGFAAAPSGAVEFGLEPGTFTPGFSGPAAGQAGAAANFAFTLKLNVIDPSRPRYPAGTIKDFHLDLPKGMIANPTPFPECPVVLLGLQGFGQCPADTVVGSAQTRIGDPGSTLTTPPPSIPNRLYRVPAIGDEAAAFAFKASLTYVVRMGATATPERDYRIRTTVLKANEAAPLTEAVITLYGIPAEYQGGSAFVPAPLPPSEPRHRFLSVPTRCDGDPLRVDLAMDPWAYTVYSPFSTHAEVAFPTGCDQLNFDPSIAVASDSKQAGQPAGYKVDLDVPQNTDPVNGLETPNLKDAVVALPEGVAISAGQANGLDACSDAQIDLDADTVPQCPAASKIGEVEIVSHLLDHPVTGNVFVGTQQSADSESGDMYRIFIAAHAPGVRIKLLGHVKANKTTGQLTATFTDNPELPFSKFSLAFKGGDTAPLANPGCGSHTTTTALTPWGGPAAAPSSVFAVDEACDQQGFSPAFAAGSANPAAGEASAFSVSIARPDRTQELSTLESVKLPKGLLGYVSKVALCGHADADWGACPAASRIGRVEVSAGSGNAPVWVPQPGKTPTSVSLAGPYKGAPYSLSVVVPAQAGPFDLGRVVVRNPLHLDRDTTQLSTNIDVSRVFDRDGNLKQTIQGGMPTIMEGIPLRVRDLRVIVDREGFTINPTSCVASTVDATLKSVTGQTAAVGARFQANGCRSLAFKPRLGMRLTGKRQVRTGTHPGLTATLRQAKDQANIAKARVTLPKSVVLDPNNSTDPALVCDYDKALASDCPASSVIGKARANTPLLNKPLTGNVHLVQGIRFGPTGNRIRTTPAVLVKLRGDVDIDLRGQTTVSRNRLVTTFNEIPDAPVSRFALKINGGKKGILVITRTRKAKINLCAKPHSHRAGVAINGQNGKKASFNTKVKTPCTKKQKNKAGKKKSKK